MQDWSTSLIVAAAAFLAAVLWRVRPAMGGKKRVSRGALREARARVEAAPDDATRARALCDAADIVAAGVGGGPRAAAQFQRALRADPASVEIVQRAVAGLARRPRTLEVLLWRHLGATPWTGPTRDSARAALEALRNLYDGRLRSSFRARAVSNALDAMR